MRNLNLLFTKRWEPDVQPGRQPFLVIAEEALPSCGWLRLLQTGKKKSNERGPHSNTGELKNAGEGCDRDSPSGTSLG